MLQKPAAFFGSLHSTIWQGRPMAQPQVDGLNNILKSLDKIAPGLVETAQCAYILATAYHESAATMQPIHEYGFGRGKRYGEPDGPWGQVYYGRGLVQLTWYANYVKADRELRKLGVLHPPADDLMRDPNLALRPDVAAAVLIWGMVQGWFTGLMLGDYINAGKTDFIRARRIVNGEDCAAKIAAYAEHFLEALREGQWAAPSSELVS